MVIYPMIKFSHNLSVSDLRKLYGLVTVTALNNRNVNLTRHIYKVWWLFRTLAYSYKLESNELGEGRVALVTQKLQRSDLSEYFNVKKLTRSSITYKIRRKIFFSFYWMTWGLAFFFKYYRDTKKLLSAFAIIDLAKILESNKIENFPHQVFIFLNEKQYYEGLFAIAVQRCQLRALSVCHGFYRDTGKTITLSNTNANNYLNIICPEQVTLGVIQSEIISKNYHQNVRCYPLGKPISPIEKNIAPASSLEDKNCFIVLVLDTRELKDQNIEMIRSLQEELIPFKIKKHPDDQFNYGCPAVKELKFDSLANVKIFGANSTLILQLGRLGAEIFLYNKSDFLNYIPKNYLKSDKSFIKVENYSWQDFIGYIGDDYYRELSAILDLEC